MKAFKQLFLVLIISTLLIGTYNPIQAVEESSIQFTEEEKQFISNTQSERIKMGILPHVFPLSDCPPNVEDYIGTNVETLNLISEKTGLNFEFGRIPLEDKSPYQSLIDGEFELVAGTIKLDSYVNDPNLLLSERFDDGSLICISVKNVDPSIFETGKISVMKGYQTGTEYAAKQFPSLEVIYYEDNQQVIEAVNSGETDIAMISRYVGIYELQSPVNENLAVLSPYQMEMDSCIMGINTEKSNIAISIINKALAQMSESEYNHIQMNFSITHPYSISVAEYLYKSRFLILIVSVVFLILLFLTIKLLSSQRDRKILSRDSLTQAYTEAGFELAISKIITKTSKQLFIVDFDLRNFSTYNELHGKEKGDELLKSISKIVASFLSEHDIICRSYADNFRALVCKNDLDELLEDIENANILFNEITDNKMTFNFGVYPIINTSIPISKMLDFAALARKSVRRKEDVFIGVFDDKFYEQHRSEVKMVEYFDKAIANKEFIAYYQPKFDTETKKIIGAEALVRWATTPDTILMPAQFVDLFEKNGLIQKLDFYMLEQVCSLLKKLRDEGKEIVPISVNFSRVHLFTKSFIEKIKAIVELYDIPRQYIEIECTETAMTYDTDLSKDILGELREAGFEIAMDDFGKGYSSLNTLSSMPLDIVKLDRGFLSEALEDDKNRANRVISGVISLVHDLSLKIVAEGVETEEQYLFLKSMKCDYIQGYFFSRPLSEEAFLKELLLNIYIK